MSADARRGLISIIVPIHNEAELLGRFLTLLRERAPHAEIIVVDGGSRDRSPEIARELADLLLVSEPGRARQLNSGARVATGDTLWFLHADSEVPRDCVAQIERQLRDDGVGGGYFRIRLPRDRAVYRLTDSFAHYAGKLLRIRCGDHGFFCRREVFQAIGGFPEVALMEDVEFFRALHRHGKVAAISSRLIVNARRYEQIGPAKLTFAYGVIAMLYALGVSLRFLARIYQRVCTSSDSSDSSSLKTCDWRSNAVSRSRSS